MHPQENIIPPTDASADAGEFKLDFCGIGVGKAGTTWIARCLAEHPSVCMALGKEVNFFLRKHILSSLPARRFHYGTSHYDEGLDWYKQKFTHYRPGQIRGEFSNGYLADPESAGLLHDHNPEMKLLCCFRNPVDATYAGFFELSRFQPLPDNAEEAIAKYPQLLDYYRYHHNLQPFLKRFPRERIHFMLYDDIKTDSARSYRGICEFLGIDPSFVPPGLHERVNPRKVLRSRALRNLRSAIGDFMVSTPTTRKLRAALVRTGAARHAGKLFRLNEKPGTVPPMALETRRRLVEVFRKENEALGDLLHRDLSHWNTCS
jgi:hypothetical protein